MLFVLSSFVIASVFAEGNLHPSREDLNRGREVIEWAIQAREMPSLMPTEVDSRLSVSVRLARPESEGALIQRRWYRVVHGPAHVRLDLASYQITWRAKANNGVFLHLPLDEFSACITEDALEQAIGTNYERSRSSLRHFWNQTPPAGIRPHQDAYNYDLANGFRLTFAFDYVCASEVNISQPKEVGWVPQSADMEN